MRILWVSPFLPHPQARHAGARGEYQWMAALAERHAITLVARIEPDERDAAIALCPMLAVLHTLTFAPPRGVITAAAIVGSYIRLGRVAQRIEDAGTSTSSTPSGSRRAWACGARATSGG